MLKELNLLFRKAKVVRKKQSKKSNNGKAVKNGFPVVFLVEGESSDISNYVVDYKHIDKKGFQITHNMLKSMWEKSTNVQKKPLLVISIANDDKTTFVLHCIINLQKKEQ